MKRFEGRNDRGTFRIDCEKIEQDENGGVHFFIGDQTVAYYKECESWMCEILPGTYKIEDLKVTRIEPVTKKWWQFWK